MASTLSYILAPADEDKLFEFLSRFELTLYPDRIPADWTPIVVEPGCLEGVDFTTGYLAAENLAPIMTRSVKRGREKGALEIDENQSPVMHFERSLFDDEGALCGGRLWTWLDVTGDMQRNPAFPDAFRRMWVQLRDYIVSNSTKSNPAGWYIGKGARALHERGTVLKAGGHKGRPVKPYIPKT